MTHLRTKALLHQQGEMVKISEKPIDQLDLVLETLVQTLGEFEQLVLQVELIRAVGEKRAIRDALTSKLHTFLHEQAGPQFGHLKALTLNDNRLNAYQLARELLKQAEDDLQVLQQQIMPALLADFPTAEQVECLQRLLA